MRRSTNGNAALRRRADLALLIVVAIWGMTFVVIKDVTARWDKHLMTFVAVRFWIATACFLPFLLRTRGAGLQIPWTAGAFAGLALFGGYAFQTAGLAYTTPTRAGFLTGLCVLLVPVGARLLGRPVPAAAVLGLLVATPGMVLLSLNESLEIGFGEMLVLVCAVAFAIQILIVDRHARHVDPIRFTALQCLVTAVGATLLAIVFELPAHGLPPMDQRVFYAALFCGFLATTIAFLVQTAAQRLTDATHVAVIFATEPVFAALSSWIVLGEWLTPGMWLGGALILGGMLWAEFGWPRRKRVP